MLNIDWFNPYDETPYSAGAIYFVILNLVRSERYKFILAGIIPSPREPEKHINTHLSPIVDDLKQLYKGVIMLLYFSGTTLIRAIVSCVSCDLPASRKVGGFYSFMSAPSASSSSSHPHLVTSQIILGLILVCGTSQLRNPQS